MGFGTFGGEGGKDTIPRSDLERTEIPLPPLIPRQPFARIVQDVERIRDQPVASGIAIEGLCGGLMQRAFAGELFT